MAETTVKRQTLPQNTASAAKPVEKAKKVQFQVLIKNSTVQRSLEETLGDAMKAKTFTSSLISAVNTNPALRDCDGMTIISAALLGESLKLSPSPQLGQYYLVPFKMKAKTDKSGNEIEPAKTVATFIMGYRGFYQLALRSGQYKSLDAVEIKEGELKSYNPITGEIDLDPIEDPEDRDNAKTIGYYAWFELVNGFRKAMYWPKKKMLLHADKYSAAFSLNGTHGRYPKVSYADFEAHKYDPKDAWLYSSFWYQDFDGMAKKTMIRQLISHYGIMSIDMEKAYINDNTFHESIDNSEEPVYFDSPQLSETPIDVETGEVKE